MESDTRTKPRFATYGPEYEPVEKSWHEYFTEARRQDHPDPADSGDADDSVPESITITTPAYEVENPSKSVGTPQGLLTWRNRLLANGWQIKVGHSVAWHEDSYYKNGNLNQPAHEEEQWWINAVKNGRYLTISYNVSGGATVSARTVRRVTGSLTQLSDKQLKEMVEDENESA